MIIIGFVIAVFFIIMICLICRGYLEDIIDLEKRVLQLEKRLEDYRKEVKIIPEKEGDDKVACKKGKGGRRK